MFKRGLGKSVHIVGRACRLPGAPAVEDFWTNLARGTCTISAIGHDRWPTQRFLDVRPGQPGKSYTFAAGVLDGVWGFDPVAFGISPREALQMDPQQRLALQLVWEALEDALIPRSRIAGRHVGVYAGASALDHSTFRMFDAASADAYFMIGNTLSLISNRVSHAFDLRGPSLTIDTACSSSLVALHHAMTALETGEIDMAVVLAVNLLLSPFPFIGFSQASMLSPDGLCRAFDAKANGYVRAEGGVALVLACDDATDLPAARRYARILGTGVNSDGHTSGVSLPSSASQERMLSQTYARAELAPECLAFIEAHGTGTRVGDPAEAFALGRALGAGRGRPLPIGSVKSNIGHLEPASGLAGVLKAMLSLEHDLLPATLHVDEPNPDIPFGELNLRLARRPIRLRRTKGGRAAGVSSFGFGGTNAHVIVADPIPKRRPALAVPRGGVSTGKPSRAALVLLSGMSTGAVRALAQRYLANHADLCADPWLLARTLGHGREMLPERVAFSASSAADCGRAMEAIAEGRDDPRLVRGRVLSRDAKTAFVFSGNGAQWPGMGRSAFAHNAAFRAAFGSIDRLFHPLAGWSLVEALSAPDLERRLVRTSTAQPLLFAIQIALVAALDELGLTPDVVLGHSVGEVAAAHVAGALDLETAVQVICARSRHQELARGLGAMAALRLGEDAAHAALARSGVDGLEIAAVNSPGSVTLAGTAAAIEAFAGFAAAGGAGCKVLDLDYPFHSRLMAPVERPLRAELARMNAKDGALDFVSTVTGMTARGSELGADYWWHNVRAPVRFSAAVVTARAAGAQIFLEIGPRPLLQSYLRECVVEAGLNAAALATLPGPDTTHGDPIPAIAAAAVTRGAAVDAGRAFGARPAAMPRLPTYPWQNTPYRPQDTVEALGRLAATTPHHPLVGWQLLAKDNGWRAHIDPNNIAWLADHRVDGQIVFPGAGFVEIALAAARQWLGVDRVEIRDMDILSPLILRDGETSEVRVLLAATTATLEIASRPRLSDQDFQVHAVCRVASLSAGTLPNERAALRSHAKSGTYAPEAVYRAARRFGLEYGPAFRRIKQLRRAGKTVVEMTFAAPAADNCDLALHPCDLDAAFHGLFVLAATDRKREPVPLVPIRFGELRLYQCGRRAAFARLSLRRHGTRSAQADVCLFDADGGLIAALSDARFAQMRLRNQPGAADMAYREVWRALPGLSADQPSSTGAFASIARRARETVGAASPHAEEPRLLLEAAARRIVYDAVAALAGPDGEVRAPSRSPLLGTLLLRLESSGLASEAGDRWRVAPVCELPPAADLLRTTLAEHPHWSADCALLNRAARRIQALLTVDRDRISEPAYSPPILDHYFAASPRLQPATLRLGRVVGEAIGARAARRPWQVCLLGAQGELPRLLADLMAGGNGRLVVAESDKRLIERARLQMRSRAGIDIIDLATGASGLGLHAPYDLVVSAFGLGRLGQADDILGQAAGMLAADGLLLAIEALPDAFHDVVFGPDADASHPLDAQFPVGRLRTGQEWLTQLQRAGMSGVEAVTLGEESASQVLLIASAGADLNAPVRIDGTASAAGHDGAVSVMLAGTGAPDRAFARALLGSLDTLRETALLGGSDKVNGSHVALAADGSPSRGNGAAHAPDLPDGAREIVWIARSPCADEDAPSGAVARQVTGLAELLTRHHGRIERLWVVVGGGQQNCVGAEPSAQAAAEALWAFARTAANEFSDVDIRLVAVAQGFSDAAAARQLARLIRLPLAERELLLSEQGIRALRVHRGLAPAPPPRPSRAKREIAALEQARAGQLESLGWRRRPLRPPRPGEVTIDLAATGLNFRDVMWGLGLLPEEALEGGFAGPTLGFECSGTISAVGAGVENFTIGDRVVALAPQAFASKVTVAAGAVIHLPKRIDLAAAACIPVAFLTAYYGLRELAKLRKGEWVLIHGGAGGVGLAALQIAHWCGARVIATAGSHEKRDLLSLLGAEHVLSSRTLAFVDEVRAVTGKGVDVVLNSLSGEAMERSLELLAPFGRFVELGKRDFYANTKVAMRPLRRNVSYFAVDADQLLAEHPQLAGRVMTELMHLFGEGALHPLPYRTFAAGEIIDAFRLMQHSGHIGKIIVMPPAKDSTAVAHDRPPFAAASNGAHVIVGGLGGFGVATAQWLADRGARTLVLVGRSGRANDDLQQRLADLRLDGTDVRLHACDVTDATELAKLLAAVRREMPIRGIVHAAMVLRDALIADLDGGDLQRVLQPKIDGATHLDRLTRGDALDYFWLYSSIATLIGNPGQGAYVAANGYLEGLARARRGVGLPAVAVRWGAIEDVGVLAHDRKTAAHLARRAGAGAIRAHDALNLLGEAIGIDDGSQEGAVVTLAAMDWAAASTQLATLRTPTFQELKGENEGATLAASIDLADAIKGLDDTVAHDLVARRLAAKLAGILRMAADDLNWHRPLPEMGLDSLMAVELQMSAVREFALELPLTALGDSATISSIAGKMVAQVRAGNAARAPQRTADLDLADKHVEGSLDATAIERLGGEIDRRARRHTRVLQ